jgi:ubiquinone biosynthesis protein COQ9
MRACRSVACRRMYHSTDHPPPPGPFSTAERAILSAAYKHVPERGFTQHALSLGARDAGYPDISTTVLPDGSFSLIKYHLVTKREALAPRSAAIFHAPAPTPAPPPDNAAAAKHEQAPAVEERVERLTWERLLSNQDIIHRWQEVCETTFGLDPQSWDIHRSILGLPRSSAQFTQPLKPEHFPPSPLLENSNPQSRFSQTHPFANSLQALAIMAQPTRVPATLQELGLLADEIYHLAGDKSVDPSWYTKRASLSAIYASSELFMTNDKSPGFGETRAFLDRRLEESIKLGGALAGAGQWLSFTAMAGVNVLRSKGVRI